MQEQDRLDQITRRIIGAAIEVHKTLGHRVGLLNNFHVRILKDGLKRMVNESPDSACSAVNK